MRSTPFTVKGPFNSFEHNLLIRKRVKDADRSYMKLAFMYFEFVRMRSSVLKRTSRLRAATDRFHDRAVDMLQKRTEEEGRQDDRLYRP